MAEDQFNPREATLIYQLAHRTLMSGDSIARAAVDLGISRNYATSLLQRAKRAGHIEITIRGLEESVSTLQEQLLDKVAPFGVHTVRVTPGVPRSSEIEGDALVTEGIYNFVMRSLAVTAADYVSRLLTRNATICLGGGRRLLEFVRRLPISPKTEATARPLLVRPHARISQVIDNETVLHTLRGRNPSVRVLTPTLLPGEDIKHALKQPLVAATFDDDVAVKPSLCVLDVAGVPEEILQPPATRPTQWRSNPDYKEYLRGVSEMLWLLDDKAQKKMDARMVTDPVPRGYEDDAEQLLRDRGVVGGFNGFGLAEDGAVVEQKIREQALAVHPETIRKWARSGTTDVVVLANGSSAAKAVGAVVRGGYCTTLIVNASIAAVLIGGEPSPADPSD